MLRLDLFKKHSHGKRSLNQELMSDKNFTRKLLKNVLVLRTIILINKNKICSIIGKESEVNANTLPYSTRLNWMQS